MTGRQARVSEQWAARPVLGGALRLLVLLGPVGVGLLTAVAVAHALPAAATTGGRVLWWAAVFALSGAAVFGTDRLARRLLPLAVLLELSLIFPDRAPSRLRAARTSSVRDLDAQLARLRGEGVPMEPYEAAETVVTLVGILGLHDKRTRGHSERVRAFTDLLSAELGLDERDRSRLRWAALVHDLGKLSVPASVLNSPRILDDAGWDVMRRHPEEGERLLAGLLPWLGEWGDAVGQHHERYDGTGYPSGLAGEQISYAGRIVALADSFEVMTSARSYKQPRSAAWARRELTRCAGSQFDPALVRAFLGISIGRLRWVLGPITWLAELPFVATADRSGQAVKVASVGVLAAGIVTGTVWPGGPLGPQPGSAEVGGPRIVADGGAPSPSGGAEARAEPALTSAPAPTPALTPAATAPLRPRPGSRASTPAAAPSPSTGNPLGGAQPAVSSPRPADRPPASPPTAAGRPASPPPAAADGTLYLTPDGLSLQPSPRRSVLPLSADRPLRFDHALPAGAAVPPVRDLVLFAAFDDRRGSAKLAARLLDCAEAAGSRCVELGRAQVPQRKQGGFTSYVFGLARDDDDRDGARGSRVLRLEVELREPGAKGQARLAVGGDTTPSRLRLSTED